MPSFFPPKRATAYTFYVSLISQADTKLFLAAPGIVAGDVRVSIDGGALNNLTTLPTVTPAGGKLVKVDLSAAEMTGDNIAILFSKVTGATWADLTVLLQPTVRQIDDLATAASITPLATSAQVAALPAPPTVAQILAGVVEGTITVQGALRLALATLVGRSNGGGTTTINFRDQANAKNRVQATVDQSGNRSAVTTDTSD